MLAQFDNLDDVNSKFNGTICRYKGEPVSVIEVLPSENTPGSYMLRLKSVQERALLSIEITDPAFSFRDFNIGYSNWQNYAVWWYRKPLKQYQQGLKKNQVGFRALNYDQDLQFGWNNSCIKMLQNQYPTMETCHRAITTAGHINMAFHRDFALFALPDEPMVGLEFRGRPVGKGSTDLQKFDLKPECSYLQETLQEIMTAEHTRRRSLYE